MRRQRQAERVQAMEPLVQWLVVADKGELIARAFRLNPARWAAKLGALLKRHEGADIVPVLVDLLGQVHVSDLGARLREVRGAQVYVRRWQLLCEAAISATLERRQQVKG